MKYLYSLLCVCLLLCACGNQNTPSNGDIYSPITKSERKAIEKSIADNYDCLVSWLGGNKGDEFEIMRIESVAEYDAADVFYNTYKCFGDKYAQYTVIMTEDSMYLEEISYLKERIYRVDFWTKWVYLSEGEIRDIQEGKRGNRHLYFDSHFDFIPVRYNDGCECDCWQYYK